MTLTVRLTPHLQAQLDKYCKARGTTKTHVVTELLSQHLSASPKRAKTAYQLAREFDIVGRYASGRGDLASNRKKILAEKLRAKHSR